MASPKEKVEQLITNCSMVFKSYEYEVLVSKNKANLWHFTANKKDKKFVVYCTPDITKVRGIIKVALKKIPKGTKLVVICSDFEEQDSKQAEEFKYSLLTISTIKKYGTDMLEVNIKA